MVALLAMSVSFGQTAQMAESKIYALVCPDTQAPFYVGKTSMLPGRRMHSHMRGGRNPESKKNFWVAGLLAQGKAPVMVILDTCTVAESAERERAWFDRLSRDNVLLNTYVCGAGNPGIGRVKWTPELEARLGKVADATLAKEIGCHRKTVSYRREQLKIPASFDRTNNTPPPSNGGWNRTAFPQAILDQLGSMPDAQLAKVAGSNKHTISRLRREAGITDYAARTGNDGRIKRGEPHRRWSKRLGDTPPARTPE